jgi:adenylosuccinate lyase
MRGFAMNQHFMLEAISPLDGRYGARLGELKPLVSEWGLITYRTKIEAAWLLELAKEPLIQWAPSKAVLQVAKGLLDRVPDEFVNRVKKFEAEMNHDVKAIEYALKSELTNAGASEKDLAMIHFACTSEDINNLSYALMLKETRDKVILPSLNDLIEKLTSLAQANASLAMMSRTHGQTASPTTLGKELSVFAHRLNRQREQLLTIKFEGKMNGAVGNYNAHMAAFPEVNWPKLCKSFIEQTLLLHQNTHTTQIENHDGFVEYCDIVRRINTISIDLCRDMWGYISLGYFKQELKAGEVGSSTMPHKVNPIDFENAEGNFGLSSSFAHHFSDKLPISRWQRDLSDSTVLRSFGTFIGHYLLGVKSLTKGLGKIVVDEGRISQDLSGAYEVLGEAVQTIMRKRGVADAYERLKTATRGQAVDKESLIRLAKSVAELTESDRSYIESLTPAKYTGLAEKLVGDWVEVWQRRRS